MAKVAFYPDGRGAPEELHDASGRFDGPSCTDDFVTDGGAVELFCTRLPGHSGPHAAGSVQPGVVYASWED